MFTITIGLIILTYNSYPVEIKTCCSDKFSKVDSDWLNYMA